MQKKSPEQNYPTPVDPAAIGAQFGLTPTNTHRHTGNPMDGVRISAGDIAGLTAFVQALIPAVVSTPTSSAIYSGYVVSGGTAGTPFPSGWTVSNLGTGAYQITHNLGTTNYIVVATPLIKSVVVRIVNIYSVASTTFDFEIFDASGTSQDIGVFFILTTQANP